MDFTLFPSVFIMIFYGQQKLFYTPPVQSTASRDVGRIRLFTPCPGGRDFGSPYTLNKHKRRTLAPGCAIVLSDYEAALMREHFISVPPIIVNTIVLSLPTVKYSARLPQSASSNPWTTSGSFSSSVTKRSSSRLRMPRCRYRRTLSSRA